MKAYYLLPVLLLGTVAASCQHQEETAQVIPSPPAQVIASPSASTMQVTAPVGTPQVIPTVATPPTFPTNAPPMQTAPVSSTEEVTAYLAWLREFDAERTRETNKVLNALGANAYSAPESEVVFLQNNFRDTLKRYALLAAQKQAPTACQSFAQAYTDYTAKLAEFAQTNDILHPKPVKDNGAAEFAQAQSELRKLLAAYPNVPAFDIH